MYKTTTILVAAVVLLLISAPAVAQHRLWSATMTAGDIDFDEGVFAIGYQVPTVTLEGGGELSDAEFDLLGDTHTVGGLFQYRAGRDRPIGAIRLGIHPGFGELDLEFLTLTVDGQPLEVDRVLTNVPAVTLLQYVDPGFRWTVGQRVNARLSTTESVPALPLAAVGLLALVLGSAAYRLRCR